VYENILCDRIVLDYKAVLSAKINTGKHCGILFMFLNVVIVDAFLSSEMSWFQRQAVATLNAHSPNLGLNLLLASNCSEHLWWCWWWR